MTEQRTADGDQQVKIPETLALLPIRDLVVFPYMIVPLLVSREISAAAVDEALATRDRLVLLAAQRNENDDAPSPSTIFTLGTVGMILRMRKLSDGRVKILVQGLMRARIRDWVKSEPCFSVRVERVQEPERPAAASAETEAILRSVKADLERYAERGKPFQPELMMVVSGVDDPGRLADLVAANMTLKVGPAQSLLEESNPLERLNRVATLVKQELEILDVQATIQSRAREEMSKTQREYFLREQLRQIQTELHGGDAQAGGEAQSLRAQIEAARMSEEARGEAERQLRRLEQAHPESAEAGVIRAYLEWLVEIPWHVASEDNLDLRSAERILNEDHTALEEAKDRILEYLGVLKLTQQKRRTRSFGGPILCFMGPPGVGKSSLGRSIARALGRRFVRISLGGVRDEAEIRGHRRTYVGALPGRIIQALKQAATVNPVMLLDEIDKLGADFRGDPAAALLEVLDPEQNTTFRDHYLGVGYDLSRVLFIATANSIDGVPRALHDRMEVIRLSGYTEEEKLEIARRHVVVRQLESAGLDRAAIRFSPPALRAIITNYTREAGLRDLERQVAQICRKVARRRVEAQGHGRRAAPVRVTPASLRRYLGPPPTARPGQRSQSDEVGAATGLAWTPFGGEVLEVEAQWMPGRGSLILTGQLGEVMKESAMTALSFARARAASLGLHESFYSEREIHIHVPAGAVPKDGPSAGVTMCTALVSLLTGQPVRRQVAMTGEITLRGHILPVGGLKEKLLAAARAGLKRVIVPADNAGDLESFPRPVLKRLEVVLARSMDDVLDAALRPVAAEISEPISPKSAAGG